MRTIILAMLVALALASVASAEQINVTVTSDTAWMSANNRDTAIITVNVTDMAGPNAGLPFEGANVTLSVNSPWQLDDTSLVTDKNGVVTTKLLKTKVAGTANITVDVAALKYSDLFGWQTFDVIQTFSQPIDHLTPSSMSVSYKSQAQVRTPTRISVYIRDSNGNPVDNRNVVERVRFDAGSNGISGFLTGTSTVKSITLPVNESGYADVLYFVDPLGTNYVYITPPSPLNQKLITIDGISQGIPFKVTSVVSPEGSPYPYTMVKTGYFTIGYTFTDQYGFPTLNQPVLITTGSAGESTTLTTNKNGMVIIKYGPKDIAGIYTINATAVNNVSVSSSQKVEFVSGAPVDALLTASPQTMASRDVKDDITSILNMRVIDEKGNPVEGEAVNYRFISFSVNKIYNQTIPPSLDNGAATTSVANVDIPATSDENGEARILFHPGGFTMDINAPGYNTTATATVVVEAQWSGVKRQVTLKYLNNPYLTIESEVNPTTLKVNQTVDVTVRAKGDGWALMPKPIDVFLVNDRSGSMISEYPDREVSVMNAAQVFSSQLDYTRDYMGIVSFGGKGKQSPKDDSDCGKDGDSSDDSTYAIAHYKGTGNYADYATLDVGLTNSPATITTKINTLVPGGYTPMRYALKLAIDTMKSKGRANAVKVLVVLSDGDYNYWGDPLARGSVGPVDGTNQKYENTIKDYVSFANVPSQNMARYANLSGIKIYTIRYASDMSALGIDAMNQLASQTAGKSYSALSESQLAMVYTDIAGSLRDEAGVGTSMNLSFQNIAVNGVTVPGNQVYNYQYIPGHSSLTDTWNASVAHFPGYPVTVDSTSQWNSGTGMNFNIGTIRLGQVWESTITLKVLKEGTINVFDPSSKITTQDSTNPALLMPLKIPDVYITALPNNSAVALKAAAHLEIQNLDLTNSGSKTSADMKWSLVYDGLDQINEDVMIAPFGTELWFHLPARQVSNTTTLDTASMPIAGLDEGFYTIQVEADADDANQDTATFNILISSSGVSVVPPGVIPTIAPALVKTPKPLIKIS
ncbi:MAG TPA: hypothetical protein VMS81_07400 [Methanomicrobiales archaeon]|nr:hypothetical protein [Methanomicrobiales archaeon]